MSRLRNSLVVAGAVVVIAVAAWLARDVILGFLIGPVVSLTTGYGLQVGKAQFGTTHGVFFDVHVTHGKDPVLDAQRVDLDYALRDIFPGGEHRLGFVGLSINQPHLYVIRHKDGSFNIAGRGGRSNVPQGTRGAAKPYFFDARITDGTLELVDVVNIDPQSRHQLIVHISGDASVKSNERTRYSLTGQLLELGKQYPIKAQATIDVLRGYAIHRITSSDIPLSALANYVINSDIAEVLGGHVRDLDVRLYALGVKQDVPPEYHLAGKARLDDVAMKISVLTRPVVGIRAQVSLADDTINSRYITARIGTTPLTATGGVYDFSRPQFRLAVRVREDLSLLHRDFGFAQGQPLSGVVDARALLLSDVTNPLILADGRANQIRYRDVPISDFRASVGMNDKLVVAGEVGGRVGEINARAAARFLLTDKDVDVLAAVDGAAPPGAMPYLDRLAPLAATRGTAVASGTGLQLDAHGVFSGAGGGQSAAGTFGIDRNGVGSLGPLTVQQNPGRLVATMYLDRAHGTSGLWASADRFTLYPPNPRAELTGLPLPPFPPVSGRVDGRVVGVDINRQLVLAGTGRIESAQLQGIGVQSAQADFAGPLDRIALGGITARGEFGSFAGRGLYGTKGYALEGEFNGTLEGLRPWTGDLGAHGRISGPVAVISDGDRTLVQSTGAQLGDASVHGIPVQRVAGTFEVAGRRAVVYAASADVAGGHAVARADGSGGTLVSSSDLAAQGLRGAGLPLSSGAVLGAGTVRLDGNTPSFDGGVALVDGRLDRYRVDGSADLAYLDDVLAIHNGAGAVAERTFGFVDGTIAAVTQLPRYDLTTQLRGGDLALLAQTFALRIPYLRGTLDGDVHVGGAGSFPAIAGSVRIPEGSVNGLNFADGRADVALQRGGLAAKNGTITIGSTRAGFDASAQGRDVGLQLDAPQANLADFNDYFDPADTLAGHGSLHARFAQSGGVAFSSGAFSVKDLRVRRFSFGDTVASWYGNRGAIRGNLAVDGVGGSLRATGTVAIPRNVPLKRVTTASALDLSGTLRGIDLGVWLPALGLSAPLLGHIDATGRIRGRYPQLALDADATMLDGVFGRFPLDRVHVVAAASGNRTVIRSAEIDVAKLSVTANGSFGFAKTDRLAVNLAAHSDHLGAFVDRVFGKGYDLDGVVDATIALTGSAGAPHVEGGFDVQTLRLGKLVIPSIVGSAAIDRDRIALRDATLYLPAGQISLAGALPFELQPFGVGPQTAPLSFDVGMHGVNLDQFAAVLPSGTKLAGTLDGLFGVRGTVRAPQMVGSLGLTGGAYNGPAETQPITGVRANVGFDGTVVRLAALDATVGGGAFSASGSMTLPDLRALATPVYDVEAAMRGIRLAFPGYGSGQADGTLWLRRTADQSAGVLGGDLALTDAVIPFSAFLRAGAVASSSAAPVFSIASALPAVGSEPVGAGVFNLPLWLRGLGLDLGMTAGNNVRIRSAILDIGGRGSVRVAGTVGDPAVDGSFSATSGGSLYLNRVFRVQDATVTFSPSNGLLPYLIAHATTHIGVPSTDVTVTAQGTVPDIRLAYSSNPSYDDATIVGLLFDVSNMGAPLGGSLNGQAPSTNIMLPPNAFQQTSGGTIQLSQEAANLINAQFTARLLAPISQGLGNAFGLSDLNLSLDPTGGFGVQARRLLGHNVYFVYGTSLTYPYRTTFGVEARPRPETAVIFTVFTQQGVTYFGGVKLDPYLSTNPKIGAAGDLGGTQGFTVNIQRSFR